MKRLTLALAVVVVAADARADEPARALAVDLVPGWSRQISPSISHANETSHQNGGPSIVLGASLRTSYFLSPFIEAGWFSAYSSQSRRDVAGFGVTSYSGSMSALALLGGASFSFWRMHVRAGAGTYDLRVTADVLGDHLSTYELDMGYTAAIGGCFWRSERVRLGAELRIDAIVQASVTLATLGITASGDALTW
jgi:hypothetical protein